MKVLSIDRVRFGAFEFDRLNRLLYREGAELSLPPRAIAVLSSLIDRPGQIVSKQVLLDEVWKDANVTETSLTEAISLLRQALADDPQRPVFIQTVPRRGYRFVAPAEFIDAGSDQAARPTTGGHVSAAPPDARPWPANLPAPAAAASSGAMPYGAVAPSRVDAATRATAASEAGAPLVPARASAGAGAPLAAAHVGDGASVAVDAPVASPRPAADAIARPVAPNAPSVPLAPDERSDTAAAPTGDATWPVWLPWLFVVVTLAALTAIVVLVMRQPSTYARPVVRFAVDVPAGLRLAGEGPAITVSRDGRRVAFVARRADGPSRIYVRDMDRLEPIVLEGTDGAAAPFFSPDARWVGFFAGGSLKKVPVDGGAPVTLCAARVPLGAVWSTRRFIVFASSLTGGLSRVHETGGRPTTITTPDPAEGEARHAWPDLLPDEAGILFTGVPLAGGPEASRVAAVTFDGGHVQTLVSAGVSPHYVPTGHLLFARNRTVFAAPFDPDTRELLGPALPVLDDVVTDEESGVAQFASAPGGHTAVVRVARPEATAVFTWVPLIAPPSPAATSPPARAYTAPFPGREIRGLSLSPDGTRVAVSLGDGHRTDIWVSDLARGVQQRLTSDGQNISPIWTPDSRRLVYASRRADGPFTLQIHAIDEPGASSTTLNVTARQPLPSSASTDGLVFVDAQPSTSLDLWLQPWTGGTARPLVQTPFDETAGAVSPDRRWLAYQSNESGRWMVTLRPMNGDAAAGASSANASRASASTNVNATAIPLAASDGARLAWMPDSQSIVFTHDGRLQQVMLPTSSPQPQPQPPLPPQPPVTPRTLAPDVEAASDFGVTQDGRVFVRTRDTSAAPARLEVVLDWSRELSARVPIRPRPPKPVR